MLIGSGATELYAGITPRAWTQRYSHAVWLSRRPPGAALRDLAALSEAVVAARDRGARLHLALNAPHFLAEHLPMLADLASHAVQRLGVEAVIVADVSLMLELGRRGVPFVASTVAVAHNAEAFRLFQDLGAVRAVLPRHLKIGEIQEIASALGSGIDLEAFVLFDNCAYEEGLCRTQHDVGDTDAFCQTPWQRRVRRCDDAQLGDREREGWESAFGDFSEWLRWSDACGHPLTDEKLPNGACGLCSLHDLAAAGVTVFKLAGRQASSYRKLRGVQLVARVLEEIEQGGSPESCARRAQELRAAPELCRSGAMCYYPESRLLVL